MGLGNVNWTRVEESTPGSQLAPGGYVCRITGIEDVADKEYIWVMYDVIEGEKTGIYAGLTSNDDWKHRFTRSYKESAQGMFKAFLCRLEESNKGRFNIEQWQAAGANERAFIGLEIGLVFQEEQYTNKDGQDKKRTVVVGVEATQDIRGNNYRLPDPQDRRENKVDGVAPSNANDAAASVYDSSVPF